MPSRAAIRPRLRRNQLASKRGGRGLCQMAAFRETILTPAPAATPAASTLLRVIRGFPAFLFPARALPALLLALAAFLTPTASASCGMPTHLPSSPFAGGEDYRFTLWRSLGQIKVSPTVTLEIPLGFTPIPNRQSSRLLGVGWSFPILESTFLATNDRDYEMRFPTGHRQTFHKTRAAGHLEGRGWKAVVSGKLTTAQSSCGWTLTFESGRLQKLRTPDGSNVEFQRNPAGTQTVTINGKTVLTYKPDFDRATTRRIAHLTLQDGRHALLRFAYRPALLEVLEPTLAGPPKKVQKTERIETLSSIQWDGEKEQPILFKQDEVRFPGALTGQGVPSQLYKWNPVTADLTQEDEKRFSPIRVRHLKCMQVTHPDGKTEIFDRNDGRLSVFQAKDGPIIITEWMPSHIRDDNQIPIARKILHLKDGRETLVLQRWLDENNRDRKLLMLKDGKKVLYEFSPTELSQKDADSGKLLLRKTYDAQKRITSYQNETTTYRFAYPQGGSEKTATLTRITSAGESTKQIPLESLLKITEKL